MNRGKAEWLSSQSEIPLCGKCGGLEKCIMLIFYIVWLKIDIISDIQVI
ncbi:MAG: hypothetical protein MUO34_13255 [Ignavibacteriaceae bacterium]|nr:hypothetical protein [Ignavibacteriaceae bacterium]